VSKVKWTLSRKYLNLMLKVDAIAAIAAARRVFKNVELANALGLSETVVSKYYHGISIPATQTAKNILNLLLSDGFVKKYVSRIMSEYGWDLNKVFTEPTFQQYVALYFKYKVISGLAGSILDKLLTLPDYSLNIAAFLSSWFNVPVILAVEEPAIIGYESKAHLALRKGDTVVTVHSVLNNEVADHFSYFISTYELRHILALTIVLMDEESVANKLKKTKIINILP